MEYKSKEIGPLVPEIIAIVGGMISTIIFVLPFEIVLGFLGGLTAPIVEEPFKVIGILFLALYYPYTMKTKRDGMILGGLAGLGFAFTENFLYLIRGEMGYFYVPDLVITRAIFPLTMHILASALVGYSLLFIAQKSFDRNSLNLSTFIERITSRNTLSIIIIAMALHFQYNTLSDMIGENGTILGIGIVIFVFYKLYHYLPEQTDSIMITNPIQLLSDAIGFKGDKGEKKLGLFCNKCGAANVEGSTYCSRCGNRISSS